MADKIVRFTAPWCAPCKALAKSLEGVDLGVEMEVVDIEESPDMAKLVGIRSVPTMVYLRDGEEIDRRVGAMSVDRLKDWIATV